MPASEAQAFALYLTGPVLAFAAVFAAGTLVDQHMTRTPRGVPAWRKALAYGRFAGAVLAACAVALVCSYVDEAD